MEKGGQKRKVRGGKRKGVRGEVEGGQREEWLPRAPGTSLAAPQLCIGVA